ncbi:unnamed protein product [Acanthoscelides obtectus]|uniref:Uncharacterized protein n=1 Tax=Acanthoscelides obtectus TaxID=200917 RepID=A0A9P0PU74_ACAOB|nr:unnamed protein product [Acanthoscelides obtectus]CAK1664943.1 hypothetical protein AOBTE_LOCUS24567 [Acanthoscelides obtectus]
MIYNNVLILVIRFSYSREPTLVDFTYDLNYK